MFRIIKTASEVLQKEVIRKAVAEAEARKFYDKKALSPSMDFMCQRKAYYNLTYSGGKHLSVDQRDISYEGTRAMYVGNVFHDYVQKQFKDAGVLLLNEMPLKDPEYHLSARLDMVIESNNQPWLVELKSSQSYPLKKFVDEGAPDLEHQKQLQLYFHLLAVNANVPEIKAVLKGREVTRGIILYESKNNHELLEFEVNKNQEIIDELLRYSTYVWNRYMKNKVPVVPFDRDSPECLYKCKAQYYEMCHGEKKPTKEQIKDKNIWGFGSAKEINKDPKFV